jgi:hypothetical protein
MPPWLIAAMKVNAREGPFLPMRFRGRNVYLEWLSDQPVGTWIVGFQISKDGRWRKNMLTIVCRTEPGPLLFLEARKISSDITSIDALEDDLIRHNVPIMKGGFGNPTLYADYKHAVTMYTTPDYDDDYYKTMGSQLAALNSSGHLSHVK